MRQQGKGTRYPGVYRVNNDTHRIRAVGIDPRTGRKKQVEKLVNGVSAQEAARLRAELAEEIRAPVVLAQRQRVGDFARSWIRSKALGVDATTASTYADALEHHVLPVFGNYFYDAVTKADVQRWVDDCLELRAADGKEPRYSRNTVHGWFRTFRTMTRDAVDTLELTRDPTLRIRFPPEEERDPNRLSPDELNRFIDAMKQRYPRQHGLVVLLGFTGLRFCHGSALKWEDWDEQQQVISVKRKQVKGVVGPVSRKKRAPRVIPVPPELATALAAHRQQLKLDKTPNPQGWMFPSSAGTLRTPNTLDRCWAQCLKATGITRRFTIHGLRYSFTDLIRLAKVDAVTRREMTGHVTEEMQRHYSTVDVAEVRTAMNSAMAVLTNAAEAAAAKRKEEGVNAGVN